MSSNYPCLELIFIVIVRAIEVIPYFTLDNAYLFDFVAIKYNLSSEVRLSKLHVEVGLLRENLTEILFYADAVGTDITFSFEPALCGRFVKIWIEKKDYLTICEIEIYGSTGKTEI